MTYTTPQCLAMILCDHVYRDAASGKYSILGTFDGLQVAKLPSVMQFAVYLAITGGRGECRLRLLVGQSEGMVDPDADAVVFDLPSFEINDPVAVIQACFTATATFYHPGMYECELYANDEQIAMRTLMIIDASSSEA